MAALEAEQKREEQALLAGAPALTLPASTAPSTPPVAPDASNPNSTNNLNPIGSGIKSMPSSRRPSGGSKDDLSFHLNKFSITPGGSTTASALGGAASAGAAGRASLDGVARDGQAAQNGNEPFSPGFAGKFVFDDDDSGAPGSFLLPPPRFTSPLSSLTFLLPPISQSSTSTPPRTLPTSVPSVLRPRPSGLSSTRRPLPTEPSSQDKSVSPPSIPKPSLSPVDLLPSLLLLESEPTLLTLEQTRPSLGRSLERLRLVSESDEPRLEELEVLED